MTLFSRRFPVVLPGCPPYERPWLPQLSLQVATYDKLPYMFSLALKFVLVLLKIFPFSGTRVAKPGGSQCCYEQFPPMLCHLIRLWSLMLCRPSLFWSKIDSPLCQAHFECLVCEVKSDLVWNTLITFDQLQNILIVIFDRDEKRTAKKILEFCDRCCYSA